MQVNGPKYKKINKRRVTKSFVVFFLAEMNIQLTGNLTLYSVPYLFSLLGLLKRIDWREIVEKVLCSLRSLKEQSVNKGI